MLLLLLAVVVVVAVVFVVELAVVMVAAAVAAAAAVAVAAVVVVVVGVVAVTFPPLLQPQYWKEFSQHVAGLSHGNHIQFAKMLLLNIVGQCVVFCVVYHVLYLGFFGLAQVSETVCVIMGRSRLHLRVSELRRLRESWRPS